MRRITRARACNLLARMPEQPGLADADGRLAPALAHSAEETHGNPLFLRELAHWYAESQTETAAAAPLSLEALLGRAHLLAELELLRPEGDVRERALTLLTAGRQAWTAPGSGRSDGT